jgi:hypothetical protein
MSCRGSGVDERDGIRHPVHRLEADADPVGRCGRDIFADEISPDRKLPVSPVHEHGQLDPGGPSKGGHRIHGGAAASSRVEDIIDKDQGPAVQIERQVGRLQHADPAPRGEVVPVHRYIHRREDRTDSLDLPDMAGDPLGNGPAAGGNTGQHEIRKLVILLDDLVGDPSDRPADRLLVHDEHPLLGVHFRLLDDFGFFHVSLGDSRVLLKGTVKVQLAIDLEAALARRHSARCFSIQSSKAFSKPMSRPAFWLSIHL